jgi:aminoglycoside phosphotransferase family enzyme
VNESWATIALLENPETYGIDTVTRLETHFSWIFFVDGEVFKLKKPVRLPYLDFSTPERRYENAKEEVRLNRRLTTRVYHGVVPVTVAVDGSLGLSAGGRPIDWLVHMRRLDQASCLCDLLSAGRRLPVEALARRLARFHAAAEVTAHTPMSYVEKLTRQLGELRRELTRTELDLPMDLVRPLASLEDFLRCERALFESRAHAAKVVEGHGDLRPEHVFFEAEPQIIDCLEFSRALRELDTADEVAYLALECESIAGSSGIGEQILEAYCDFAGERPPRRLFDFYATLRAFVRATLALRREDERAVLEHARLRRRALAYLAAAARHAGRL